MKKLLSVLLAVLCALTLVGCGETASEDTSNTLEGTYDITLWVSESEGVAELTQEQIDAFEAANPGIVINATIEGISEGSITIFSI